MDKKSTAGTIREYKDADNNSFEIKVWQGVDNRTYFAMSDIVKAAFDLGSSASVSTYSPIAICPLYKVKGQPAREKLIDHRGAITLIRTGMQMTLGKSNVTLEINPLVEWVLEQSHPTDDLAKIEVEAVVPLYKNNLLRGAALAIRDLEVKSHADYYASARGTITLGNKLAELQRECEILNATIDDQATKLKTQAEQPRNEANNTHRDKPDKLALTEYKKLKSELEKKKFAYAELLQAQKRLVSDLAKANTETERLTKMNNALDNEIEILKGKHKALYDQYAEAKEKATFYDIIAGQPGLHYSSADIASLLHPATGLTTDDWNLKAEGYGLQYRTDKTQNNKKIWQIQPRAVKLGLGIEKRILKDGKEYYCGIAWHLSVIDHFLQCWREEGNEINPPAWGGQNSPSGEDK